jgi:hypothetical protein
MKKRIYIFSFTVLGILLAVLIDGLLGLYLQKHSFDLQPTDLDQFHSFVQVLLYVACGVWGYKSGRYWWHQLYELKKYKNRWFRNYKWA